MSRGHSRRINPWLARLKERREQRECSVLFKLNHDYAVAPEDRKTKDMWSFTDRGITITLLRMALIQKYEPEPTPGGMPSKPKARDRVVNKAIRKLDNALNRASEKELDEVELDEGIVSDLVLDILDPKNFTPHVRHEAWREDLLTYVEGLVASLREAREAKDENSEAKKNGTTKPTAKPVKA